MALKTTHINVKQPAFPFGPEYVPDNTQPTVETRFPTEGDKIHAVDMRNVIPTPEGFSSFFGTTGLNALELPPVTQDAFTYKDSLGNNTMLAFGGYGAMYSNDGITWIESEVTTFVAQTAVGLYKFTPDMDKNYAGFVAMSSAFTRASALVGGLLTALTPVQLDVDTQTVVLLPITATNTYHRALSLEVNWDEAQDYNRLVQFINPNLASVTAGNKYYMVSEAAFGTYTALAGDTVATVLQALVGALTGQSATGGYGVFALYESDSRIKVWATAAYGADYFPPVAIYESAVPADTAAIATLANDEVMVDIPPANLGNLGYLVFTHAVDLVVGDYNLRGEGRFQTGLLGGMDETIANRFGDFSFTEINALGTTKVLIPLTSRRLALRQYTGALEAGLTVTVHDTGVAISSQLGSNLTKNTCSANMVVADVVVGRIYTLQSLGQVGSYTAILADTIHSVIAGCVAAYNLAGASVATQYGEQLIGTTGTEKLFFQPAALATMTNAAANTEIQYAFTDFRTRSNVLLAADMDLMYSLVMTLFTAPTNVLYTIYCDGEPVPVTSPLGAWSDANFQFTSAQVLTAIGAGTKLMVPLRGYTLEVRPVDAGAGTIGDVGFAFHKILTGGNVVSTHTGLVSSYISAVQGVSYYQVYKKDNFGVLRQYADLPITAVVNPVVSPYNELGVISASVVVPAGALQDVPAVDTFTHSMPVDNVGAVYGDLTILDDLFTPATVTMTYTQPTTLAPIALVTAGVMTNGVQSFLWPAIAFALPADLITFNTHNPWTFCIIQNRLYAFRKGLTYVLRLLVDSTAWEQLIPTFVNLPEIEGIFDARGRMGMWDSANSIYNGSIDNPIDFVPSIKTRANVRKVDAVRGNVILCLGFKDGFIIYSTGSIVQAKYIGGTNTFAFNSLSKVQGILNTKAVAVMDDDTHFAFTDSGLQAVGASGLQDVSPEASVYLKSSALSPRLNYIGNRYLTVAFAPEQPSWVTQRLQTYAGAVIPGFAGVVGQVGTGYTVGIQTTPLQIQIPVLRQSTVNPRIGALYARVGVNDDLRHSKVSGQLDFTNKKELRAFINELMDIVDADVVSPFLNVRLSDLFFGLPTIEYITVQLPGNDLGRELSSVGWYYMALVETYVELQTVVDALWLEFQAANAYTTTALLRTALNAVIDGTSVKIRNSSISLTADSNIGLAYVIPSYWGGDIKTYRNDTGSATDSIMIDASSTGTLLVASLVKIGYVNLTISDNAGWSFGRATIFGVGYPQLTATAINTAAITAAILAQVQAVASTSATSAVPDFVIPGGSFIATDGTAEPVDAIYTKALVLDTKLKNWGSCDVPFRALIDFIPVNARSTNPVTGAVSTAFSYQNLAKSFAIMLQDGTLNLCTQSAPDSLIEYGNCGLTQSGVTRFLDALAEFVTETGAVLEVWGSVNGTQLNSLLYSSVVSSGGSARLTKVLTGKWFRLRIIGTYTLKALEFSAEIGGKR